MGTSTISKATASVTTSASQKNPLTFSAIYTIAEAARLCGLSRGRISRWARGYSFRRGEELRSSAPVVHTPRSIGERGAVGLDFLDLVEIRYVKAFVEAGVSWHVLRAAHERAAEMLHVDHPFATKRFFTDGQTILTRVAEPAFLDLMGNQLAFSRILGRYLAGTEGLDFDDNNMAHRWWPMGRKRLVVIDAERSFGQPIVSTEGVPTVVLSRAYFVESATAGAEPAGEIWTPEGPKAGPVVRVALGQRTPEPKRTLEKAAIVRVANWYSVEERSVRAAIEYESSFLAAA